MSLSTGPSDNMAGITDHTDAADAAAAAANLGVNPIPAPAFQPLMDAQLLAPPAMADRLSFRANNRRRKQKVLSVRQQEVQDEMYKAEKERQKQLKVQEQRRQQRLQALAAAREAVKVKTDARRLKAQAQHQKAAAMKVQRAAAIAAGAAAAAVTSSAAGTEAAGGSGQGSRAVGASARDNGGAAPPLTQPIGRASPRRRVPNKRFQDEVNACGSICGFLS